MDTEQGGRSTHLPGKTQHLVESGRGQKRSRSSNRGMGKGVPDGNPWSCPSLEDRRDEEATQGQPDNMRKCRGGPEVLGDSGLSRSR